MWLVNAGDGFDELWPWVDEASIGLPVILDLDEEVYRSYGREADGAYAPFPVQVVIDRDGVITYLAYQYDAAAVRAAIDVALARE